MVLKKCQIVVNDVFDELTQENYRLFDELIFADKCLTILLEFKTFIELNCDNFKLNLEENKLQKYEHLCEKLKQLLNENNRTLKTFDDNIKSKVKSEDNDNKCVNTLEIIENGFDDRQPKNDQRKRQKEKKKDVFKLSKKKIQRCDWPGCRFQSSSKDSLRKHSLIHSEKKFVCDRPECQYRSYKKSDLNKHLISHTNRDSNPKVEKPKKPEFVCHYSDCTERFTSEKRFNYHLWKHRMVNNRFVCDFPGCDAKYRRYYSIVEHKRTHTGEKPYECTECGETFAATECLRKHVRNTHRPLNEPMVCTLDNCNRIFKSLISLKMHQKVYHLMEKKFHCDYPNCSYKCSLEDMLITHKKVHSDERPFKCHFTGCDKSYKRKGMLTTHVMTHTAQYNIPCPHNGCDKLFRTKCGLRKHISSVHSGKRFPCDWPGCEYIGTRTETLKRHVLVHDTQPRVACIWPNCDKMFKNASYMRQHLLIHKGVKRHACPWPGCQYRCVTSGNLKIHINNRHKK